MDTHLELNLIAELITCCLFVWSQSTLCNQIKCANSLSHLKLSKQLVKRGVNGSALALYLYKLGRSLFPDVESDSGIIWRREKPVSPAFCLDVARVCILRSLTLVDEICKRCKRNTLCQRD